MNRVVCCLGLVFVLACSPKDGGLTSEGMDVTTHVGSGSGSSDSESTTQTSVSSDSESESETETETGDDPPPDACPASPVLESLSGVFDGIEVGFEYPDQADWAQSCTVTAHTGDLITGESITLDCVTAEGEVVAHTLEVQASVVDAEQPTHIQAEIGESLQLTLWSRVWWAGGASWVLRDAEQLDDIRLIYYSTIEVFEGGDLETSHSPEPSFVEPLTLALHDDICETSCPQPNPDGSFVPSDECDCQREQALEFMLGPDSAKIQHGSAGAIGASMFAFVQSAIVFPNTGGCPDSSDAWYSFVVVAR
jgi:hypothetical protein